MELCCIWKSESCPQRLARKESSTYGKIMTFQIGESCNPSGYFFPPGVLHGYKCIKGPMHIIYLTSGTYDLRDETRSPLNINF